MSAFSDAVNRGVTGEALYQYLPPQKRQTVQAMLDGRVPPPTGMAARSPLVQAQMDVASAIGGEDFDLTKWKQRSDMVTQLGKTQPGTMGGQIDTVNTGIDHLAKMALLAKDLNNSNGWGFAPLASAINTLRGLKTTQQGKMQAMMDMALRYGEEITKFYAASGGGEAERTHFLTALGAARSPTELAAVIDAEAHAISGKSEQIKNQIRNALGEKGLAKYPPISAASTQLLRQIGETTAAMRGTPIPTAPPPAPPTTTPPGTPGAPAAPQTNAAPAVAQGAPGTATAGIGAPQPPPPAKPPGVRFNELMQSGLSKNEAFSAMKREGYALQQ
jgi:hypothetical protein